MHYPITLAAVGDIAFPGSLADQSTGEVFSSVASLFQGADLAIANLENPLVSNGEAAEGKCTLRGTPDWAKRMREAGIGLVTLANNHMMDHGEEGLFSTIRCLESEGILHVGAGKNREEACAARFLDVKGGGRLAFLARSSVEVSSPCYATDTRPGVAFFEQEETLDQIRNCKGKADRLILLIHWGIEEYLYPTREQRTLARSMIDSGVDLILGHHPHVIQGVERFPKGMVAYSLGNFLFDEFEWTLEEPNGVKKTFFSTLSGSNREGVLLQVTWEGPQSMRAVPVFTRIETNGVISIDSAKEREARNNRLSKVLHLPFYPAWWQVYALKKEWDLRMGGRMSPGHLVKNLAKIRLRHIKELHQTLRRSMKIVTGRSTNPYED